MNNETKTRIIKHLEEYMAAHPSLSQNELAKKSGVNVAIISAIRNGKNVIDSGGGKTTEIADKWYEMLAGFTGLKTENNYWQTVPTEQMKRILATLEDAKEFGYINVIIGETGCGKSYVSKLFAKQHPVDLFLITVGHSDTIKDLLDKIIDELKISTGQTKSKKIRDVSKHLRSMKLDGHKPMLLFDESEYMKQPALCAMKELYDNLNGVCSLVLIGTDQLTRNIERLRKRNKEGIPQFYRRIKFGIRVLPAIDRTFKQFLNSLNGGLNDSSLQRFLRENCDNYGELHDALVPAMREADRIQVPLTEKFVRTVLNMPV